MSAVISLIGILVAFVLMNYAVYRGLGLPIASILGALIIWVTSGLNIHEGLAAGMAETANVIATVTPLFIFGSILGMLYVESGAAASLGLALFRPFKNAKNPTVKRLGTIFMFFILRVLLGFTGINSMALTVTMVALVTVLFTELDMPRRYCNAVLMVAGSIEYFMPGVPTMFNILVSMFVPGFTATTAMLPRIVFMAIFILVSVFWLNAMISRDMAKGEHFEIGGGMNTGDLKDPNAKRPFWLVTLIPIVVIFLLYSFVGLEAWSALAIGTVVAGILFIPYIKVPEGKKRLGYMVEKCNRSAIIIPLYYMMTYIPATAMLASSGYALILSGISALSSVIPLPIAFAFVAVIMVLSGASAIMINANIANTIFIPAGMSVGAAGLLIILATTVLDTLPSNTGIVLHAEMTGVTIKESYPPIFKTTVVLTFGIVVLAAVCGAVGIF